MNAPATLNGRCSLRHLVRSRDNDYRAVARHYKARTGVPLTGDVLRPGVTRAAGRLSASVVVPAWNAEATLEACLHTLEGCSFNRRYPQRLEVVVVDDGSTDPTARRLRNVRSRLNLSVVTRPHRGRAAAMNAGLAIAQGDVVVSCDADMLLVHWAVEELVHRHETIGAGVLLGFRSELDPADPRLARGPDPALLTAPAGAGDNRLRFDWPGWPESMCAASDHLGALGADRRLWMPSGEAWTLPRMVYGCLFSALRRDLVAVGGYDPGFVGWGWEDTCLAARLIALGRFVIPVYTAAGWHVSHPGRSPRQWQEAARNRVRYQQLLDHPPVHPDLGEPDRAVWRPPTLPTPPALPRRLQAAGPAAFDRALHLYEVGRHDDAAAALARLDDDAAPRSLRLLHRGRALRLARRYQEAVATLEPLVRASSPATVPALAELGRAFAAQGRFPAARSCLVDALERAPRDRLLRYILRCPAYKHVRRGRRFAAQGAHHIAVSDFEAALVQQPGDLAARRAREASLTSLR